MTTQRILILAIAFTVSATAQQPGKNIPVEKDIIYGRAGGVELKLDLARPAEGVGPFPAVLCIHGGGWQLGDKQLYGDLIRGLASRGFVAASLDYRLTPRFAWPAQIEDVKCAVRFLRAHAAEYRIDADRLGVLGDSAGGHLALMAGLTGPGDGFDSDNCGDPRVSSKVQAIVDFFGPADLTSFRVPKESEPLLIRDYGWDSNQVLFNLLGSRDRSAPVFRQASPITYIDPADCPVLIFHGTADNLVSIEQSKALDRALAKAGVSHRLEIVEGEGHGWTGAKLERSITQAIEFLDKILKR